MKATFVKDGASPGEHTVRVEVDDGVRFITIADTRMLALSVDQAKTLHASLGAAISQASADDFDVVDKEGWAKTVRNNTESYGRAVVDFVGHWARHMEAAMAQGATLADCAQQASRDADDAMGERGGITGFQYGMAVSLLAQVWRHGDALRRWHNLETQLGDEGVRANEKPGAVLNPALLGMGE